MIIDLLVKHWKEVDLNFHRKNPRFIKVSSVYIGDRIKVIRENPDLEQVLDNLTSILANIASDYKDVKKFKRYKVTSGLWKGVYRTHIGKGIFLSFSMPQNAELRLIRLCTLKELYSRAVVR